MILTEHDPVYVAGRRGLGKDLEGVSGWEIVKVTDVTGNTLTVERAQDNTTALTFSTGERVEMRVNVQTLLDMISDGAGGGGGGGLLTLITKTDISGSPTTIEFTTGISSTYSGYLMFLDDVVCSDSAGYDLQLQVRVAGAWQTSNGYYYTGVSNAAQVALTDGDSGVFAPMTGWIRFGTLSSSSVSNHSGLSHLVSRRFQNAPIVYEKGFMYNSTSAIDGVRLLFQSSKTFVSGTVKWVGIANE